MTVFPKILPKTHYLKDVSQLLVQTLEEMRSRKKEREKARCKELLEEKKINNELIKRDKSSEADWRVD